MPSITALTKSIEALSRKLTKQGYICEINTFKGESKEYQSTVEIDIEKNGAPIGCYTFKANGYNGWLRNEYGGDSIRDMKAKFFNDFKKDTL